MSLEDQPANPYAPPSTRVPAEARAWTPSAWLGGFVCIQTVSLTVDVLAYLRVIPKASFSLAWGLRALAILVALFWFATQWHRLPPRLRVVRGHFVTPASAALRNLVPFYGVYWMFAVQVALCNAINARLVRKGRTPSAPKILGIVCPLVFLITRGANAFPVEYVIAILAAWSVTWTAYMIRVEIALRAAKVKNGPFRGAPS
jgi:hypothetical protein